ncbi:unnamed protein product [Prunus brigantina]
MMRLFGLGPLTKRLWPRKELVSAVRLLVFGVGPLSVILSLVFIVGVLEGQSRLDKTCMVRSNQGKHGWV